MLKAGSYGKGRLFPTERWTPQGGVVLPLLSNILLTPFDQEMRRKGYQLTRYADWVATCESAAEARAAVTAALRNLDELGVQLHPQKTRIVHARQGFEFLGYKVKRVRIQFLNQLLVLRGWGHHYKRAPSESSSTGSTVGLCGAFGRSDSSSGGTVAGDSYRKPSCMASTGW
jgi:hypothetical protein